MLLEYALFDVFEDRDGVSMYLMPISRRQTLLRAIMAFFGHRLAMPSQI